MNPLYQGEGCQPGQKLVAQGWPQIAWDDATPEPPTFSGWTVYRSRDGILYFTDDWWSYGGEQGNLRYIFEYPGGWQWLGGTLADAEGIKIAERIGPICLKRGQTCFDNFADSENRQAYWKSGQWKLISQEDWTGQTYSGKKIIEQVQVIDRKNHPRFGTGHVPDTVFITRYCLQDNAKAFLIWFITEDELPSADSDLYERIVSTFRFVSYE